MSKTIALLLCCAMLLLSLASCNTKEELPTDVSETETETEEATQKETEKKQNALRPYQNTIITAPLTGGRNLRDPFVLLHEGKYYVYGTGWTVSVHSSDKLTSTLTNTRECVTRPSDYTDCNWAPEVYYLNGKFYMFTTYKSSKNAHRGCAIFISDKPDGPFKLHSNGYLNIDGTEASNVTNRSIGHVTPHNWDAIDGTLYIDKEGQPWMVFVHEWTSTDDGVGRMACAKLSDDLTHFISEPIELFRADDAPWARGNITDGCFMYETEDGQLLMIWSNHDGAGYSVGVAKSESGLVTGPWIHDSRMLYSKKYTNMYDGGHGMIFTDTNGYMWMAIHSPNAKVGTRVETPTYIPIKEQDGMLVWDRAERDLR